MSFIFEEKPDSRSGGEESPSQTREYYSYGETDEVFVQNYARSVIPAVVVTGIGNLWRKDIAYKWRGPLCDITATFGTLSDSPQTGSFTWNFDTTGATVTVKAGKSHVASYPPGVKQHGGAINVTKDGVEGTEIIIPAMKFNVAFRHPQGVLNLSRAFALGDATGASNSDTFFTKGAGSFLFVGATGSDGSDAEAEVTYQFAYSKNLVNEVVGGIANVTKDGWDYAWLEFADAVNAGGAVKNPIACHVDRVYDRIAFSTFFGFG